MEFEHGIVDKIEVEKLNNPIFISKIINRLDQMRIRDDIKEMKQQFLAKFNESDITTIRSNTAI